MLTLFPDRRETIEGTGHALRAGETTCLEVLEGCLKAIREWEPKVNAWVVIDREGARSQARVLDEELAAGQCRGPLHGIPFGIKDIIDVKGLPTACGFGPWRDRVADEDATLVKHLRVGGAVLLGKTVTTQFAWIDPPVTRNPWNLDRTPGGSSSGSAAAVATGMCLGAIGTQTGGSIIRPAAFCGVAGFKPAKGRVAEDGILPFAPSLDHPGPIARTVGDLRLIFDAIKSGGRDAGSEFPTFYSFIETETRTAERLRFGSTPPTLLRPRGFFDRRSDPVMLEAFERALTVLTRAGAEVLDLDEGRIDFERLLTRHRTVMAAEAAVGHEARYREHRAEYAPQIARLVEEGLSTLAGDRAGTVPAPGPPFLEPPGHVLVTPATVGPAPDSSTTGNPCFNSPFSYLGWPAVNFPVALSPDGLPLSVQLTQSAEAPSSLYQTAAWCESTLRGASPV